MYRPCGEKDSGTNNASSHRLEHILLMESAFHLITLLIGLIKYLTLIISQLMKYVLIVKEHHPRVRTHLRVSTNM